MTEGEKVVVDTAPHDLAHGPEVGPHKFTIFNKSENFAYARGLEINPSHLPLALDAMLVDGWELVSLFGQTDAKSVGFIFKWVGPNKRVQGLLEANNREIERRRAGEWLMRTFIERVDLGEIRSKRTYAAFKAHLEKPYGE